MPCFWNTRFNPTPTGLMHLGHVYLCLVNQYEAHLHGGVFKVRFDDTHREWREFHTGPEKLAENAKQFLEEMAWLGIEPEEVCYQSEMLPTVHASLHRAAGYTPPREPLGYDQYAIAFDGVAYYPYALPLVAEKVWMDVFIQQVDYLIRGIDLITEFSLYNYFVELLGLRRVQHVYLPRLTEGTGDLNYVDGIVSKTSARQMVAQYRAAGFTPPQVRELLAKACLVDPDGPWAITNVKRQPMILVE